MSMHQLNLLVYLLPALACGLAAEIWMSLLLRAARSRSTEISGYAAARRILESASRGDISVQQTPGRLTDYFDPSSDTLRLSEAVFHGRHVAAVAVAGHEAGQALRAAATAGASAFRSLAIAAAQFGSTAALLLIACGIVLSFDPLILFGIAAFSLVVLLQVLQLPGDLAAGRLAAGRLVELRLIPEQQMPALRRALFAAALRHLAVPSQAIGTVVHYAGRLAALVFKPRG